MFLKSLNIENLSTFVCHLKNYKVPFSEKRKIYFFFEEKKINWKDRKYFQKVITWPGKSLIFIKILPPL